jgi:PAS domain S-box-containing protein
MDRLGSDARLLAQVLDQLPAAVVIAEAPSGRVLRSNAKVNEILGQVWPAADAVADYSRDVTAFHPDGRAVEADEWPLARALMSGEVVQNEEVQIRRPDGSRVWVSLNAAPVRDDRGEIVAGVVTFLDVTARRAAERRAAEEGRRTALTLESISDGFVLLDEEWRIQYVNRRAEELLARSRDELLEVDLWAEYPELVASKFLSELNRARDEQVVAVFEATWPATSRRLSVRVWPSADGTGLAMYFQEA